MVFANKIKNHIIEALKIEADMPVKSKKTKRKNINSTKFNQANPKGIKISKNKKTLNKIDKWVPEITNI